MIADALTSTTDELMNQSGKTTPHYTRMPSKLIDEEDTVRAMRNMIFLSRVVVEISLTSPFLNNIGCDEVVAQRMLITSPNMHT
jgi:hypothetical protein